MTQDNPLLKSLRLPGETVRLPSRALTYTAKQLDQAIIDNNGELHVYPMTTYEEILMKTPDLLFSGQAIVQTFARCIPGIFSPLELLAKDVDFLLVVLRKITYGATVEVQYKHDCEDSKKHTYTININSFLQNLKELDPVTLASDTSIVLPNGQHVTLRPFFLKDVISASQRAMANQSIESQTDLEFAETLRKSIIEGLAPAIVSVDDTTEPEFIAEWLNNLPAPWVDDISTVAEKVNKFGIEFQSEVLCQDCGSTVRLNVPLNPQSFFTQPSGRVTQL